MARELDSYIWCFWVLHALLTLLYVVAFREKHKQHLVSELVMLAFLPVAGFVLLTYSRWLRWRIKRNGLDKDKQEQLMEVLEQEKNTETISAQVKYSSDVVPLNDVLYLEDVEDKRKLLTTAIRQSALNDSTILKRAIRDSDRDVSHYAVSMATNNVAIMEKRINRLQQDWEEKQEDVEYLKEFSELMRSYIEMDIMEEYTAEKLYNRYELVLDKLMTLTDDSYYLEKSVEALLHRHKEAKAEELLEDFNKRHPEEETGYLLLLKLYVAQRRHDDVEQLIGMLKQSRVRFSAEGMRQIRFWS